MFGSATLITLTALLILSVLTRETALFLLALALLVASGLSRLWERHCLTRIEYQRRFSPQHASFGEPIELEIEIFNRKLLPLSWLEVEDETPQELQPGRGRLYRSHKPQRLLLTSLLAFRPYERIRRRYTIPALARGEHVFGPVYLRSGDLFGFVTREETRDLIETVVVYPRVVPLVELGLPAQHPLGELRTQSWLFEDVTRVAGAREYRPGDSLRRIHWPATARSGLLQARVYEATTDYELAIFLNLATVEDSGWGLHYDPDILELGIVTAASLANWGLDQGYQVGVYTNGVHRWNWGNVAVDPGRDPSQLGRILTALGRLQPFAVGRFDELIPREARRLPFGATVVLVTAGLTDLAAEAALALRARGHPVTAVLTGRGSANDSITGIVVRRVGPPEIWREAPGLSLSADARTPGLFAGAPSRGAASTRLSPRTMDGGLVNGPLPIDGEG